MIEYLSVEVINAIGSFETCTNWGRLFRSKNPRKLVEDINTRLVYISLKIDHLTGNIRPPSRSGKTILTSVKAAY